MVKFLHFSDTHLGNREYGEAFREDDFYESFQEAIDIGLNEHVNFFLHTGDLFDTWNPGNHPLLRFKDFARQIAEHDRKMYIIMGDHDRPKRKDDPASKIFDFLGVKLLDDGSDDAQKNQTVRYDGEEILLYGISNMKGLRKDMLVQEYRKAEETARNYKSSVLLSHQAISPYLHPEACEAKYDDLPKTFSYLAFGHIHDHLLKPKDYPVFSYAGSTDMTSSSEIGRFLKEGKGVNLVEINNGEVKVDRVPLKSTRFQIEVSARSDNYVDEIEQVREKHSGRFGDKKPLILLTINGDADRDQVKRKLKELSEEFIFKRVRFESQKQVSVDKPNMNSLVDYFKAYFNDDEMADLANDVYETLRSEEYEEARSNILKRLGLNSGGVENDNRLHTA